MGSLNLSTLRSATKWALDNRTGISDAQLNRWITWPYLQVSQPNVHRHQPLQAEGSITLVLDQVKYDLPTLLGYTLWGLYGGWYIEGASLPDAGRVPLVGGYRPPAILAADGSFTVLHPLWDEVVVLGATWRGFRELNENARAELARQNFALLIQEQQDARTLDSED